MNGDSHSKIQSRHLARDAYVYVRQSSLRQVLENTESTERQYALQQRAVALGWKADQIIVVDKDLGQSGASSVDREGFQRLVTDVGMGRAGIVMGLEVSRLWPPAAPLRGDSLAPRRAPTASLVCSTARYSATTAPRGRDGAPFILPMLPIFRNGRS